MASFESPAQLDFEFRLLKLLLKQAGLTWATNEKKVDSRFRVLLKGETGLLIEIGNIFCDYCCINSYLMILKHQDFVYTKMY